MVNGLVINNISKRFGDLWVLRNVRASVPTGKITAFIGPNGAGKTTLFHIISGALRPDHGTVSFNRENLTGLPAHRVAKMGIGRQFQDVRTFGGLTVIENVMASIIAPTHVTPCRTWFRPRQVAEEITVNREQAMHWVEHVGLADHRHRLARDLSFGEQKLLAFARLFAARFRVLLLDEPTAGLSPSMIDQVIALVRQAIDDRGVTLALIEHDLSVVAGLATWIHFMHEGRVAFSGETRHVLGNQFVREVYIGL